MRATNQPTKKPSRLRDNLVFFFAVLGAFTGPLIVPLMVVGCCCLAYGEHHPRWAGDMELGAALYGPLVGFFAGTIGGYFAGNKLHDIIAAINGPRR